MDRDIRALAWRRPSGEARGKSWPAQELLTQQPRGSRDSQIRITSLAHRSRRAHLAVLGTSFSAHSVPASAGPLGGEPTIHAAMSRSYQLVLQCPASWRANVKLHRQLCPVATCAADNMRSFLLIRKARAQRALVFVSAAFHFVSVISRARLPFQKVLHSGGFFWISRKYPAQLL